MSLQEFLLVKITYDKGTKKEANNFFIGQLCAIKKHSAKPLVCSFMRNFKGSQEKFVFPNVRDKWQVGFDQIVKVLTPICVVRNIYTFKP